MVDETRIDYQIFKGVYPVRKLVLIFSTIFVCLALFIAVECLFVVTDIVKFSNPIVVALNYFVATSLILLGMIGLRYNYMSSTTADSDSSEPVAIENATIPNLRPIWVSNITPFRRNNLLPG